MNGLFVSAFITFAGLGLGLLIVHFSSDEPRKRASKD